MFFSDVTRRQKTEFLVIKKNVRKNDLKENNDGNVSEIGYLSYEA